MYYKKSKKYITEDKNRTEVKVYCKYCGHSQQIPAYVDQKICSYCKKMIQNNSKAHFRYKLINMIKENDKK